jgi:hypothetical protein
MSLLVRDRVQRWSRIDGTPIVVLAIVVAIILAFAFAIGHWSYDVWGAFWVGPVLFALTVPVANHVARVEEDHRAGQIVLLAFAAKVIAGAVARYVTVNGIYGNGDSTLYQDAGRLLAPAFRRGVYEDLGKISGTRFVEVLTGQVFAGIGPTNLGGFLVFSWLAFLGLVLMVRAFRIAVPEGDHPRYRLLVLFFPSLLFWPSAIGKDAWMVFCLGAAAYGLARALTGRFVGLVPLGLGLWGAAVVRPHLALLLIIAATPAVVLRAIGPRGEGTSVFHRARVILIGAALVVGVVVLTSRAEEFFGLKSLNPDTAQTFLTDVTRRTGKGGSQFDAPKPDSPVGYLEAFGTVLYRPFPGEGGGGGLALVAAAEGVLFLAVTAASLGRFSRLPRLGVRRPYVIFGLAYTFGFAYAFSSIDNFGILVRQRSQLLPFAFIALCLPKKPKPERATRRAVPPGAGAPVPWEPPALPSRSTPAPAPS